MAENRMEYLIKYILHSYFFLINHGHQGKPYACGIRKMDALLFLPRQITTSKAKCHVLLP